MSELLNVVLDLDADKLSRLDFARFFGSLVKFLNCFRMQAATNQFRIYAAFPHNSYLLYPIEGSPVSISPNSHCQGSAPIDQPIHSCVAGASVSFFLNNDSRRLSRLFKLCWPGCLRCWATKTSPRRWTSPKKAATAQPSWTEQFSKHSASARFG